MKSAKMENKESYYMIIPALVWNSKELSPNAKLLYGHITVLANKEGFAYCSNAYLAKVLDAKIPSVKTWLKQLEDLNVISREVQYKKDSKEVELRKIFIVNPNILPGIPTNTTQYTEKYEASISTDPDNTTSNNTTSNNILDVPSDDDIKSKIFFKIVELYPKNRIGNRQHGLKKFKTLDIDQAKLAATNLKRYLKVAGQYVKNLQNYITEECWSEEWLVAEETKLKTTSKKDINHNFSGTY